MSVSFAPLFIDGQEWPASSGASFEVRNPYSNEVVGLAAAATSEDVRDAIAAASRAFPAWEQTPPDARAVVVLKTVDILETAEYKEKLAARLRDELSAADALIQLDTRSSISFVREYAASIVELKGKTNPSRIPGAYIVVQRRGMGVILVIAPWNVPLSLTFRAVILPILCGNTVDLKSSEATPRSQALAVEILRKAGLPDGVLNFVCIAKAEAPARVAEMIAHPAVRKVNFTGGARVGKLIAMEAVRHLKPCVLELGGKAPVVSPAALGQICMSTERVIVLRSVAEQLSAAIQHQFSELKAGGPGHPLGPLFSQMSPECVIGLVRDAKAAGAEILLGDGTREESIVQPHIITKVTRDMQLWHHEMFGPVVVLVEVDSIEEAIERANDSGYTLMASLWTENIHTAFEVAPHIRSGTININGQTVNSDGRLVGLGGESGYGRFSVQEFTDARTLIFHLVKPQIPSLK
ncbi:ALDH-like protein [Daedalea quercina L-15889]|uniref:ALDH-like protein n=1 Tax=Daedalea quercina L-15889 TaxID=1314783 RepID=A0A165NBW1_9APHY|nr:ALDH-like protein [Daedalea quercina L-15889]